MDFVNPINATLRQSIRCMCPTAPNAEVKQRVDDFTVTAVHAYSE